MRVPKTASGECLRAAGSPCTDEGAAVAGSALSSAGSVPAKALEARRRGEPEVAVRAGVHDVRGVELAELALDVVLELLAVLALERAQLVDPVLEERALLVERVDLLTLLRLRVGDDA